ncbi:MAG: ABC transporter permease [Lachnospiraceae bacterium]|nr:ABC transporter permease [Lachnospiraceae bacterium]
MKYIGKKVLILFATLLVMSFLVFLAFEAVKGDAALSALGDNATPEQIEALREEMGLNQPMTVRYGKWLAGAARGDLGMSTNYSVSVSELMKDKIAVTVHLAVLSLILILLIGLPLGIGTSGIRSAGGDIAVGVFNQIGMAIPPFFLGILITWIFGLLLSWFRPGAYVDLSEDFGRGLGFLVFPALAIALPRAFTLIKFIRDSMAGQKRLNYVRTARSKGNDERRVLYVHMLRNALIPVITFFAMIVAEVFAGSIVIEQVFGIPGIGRLLVVSIANRDFPVILAIVLYIAVIVLTVNAVVDILYHILDPRVMLED